MHHLLTYHYTADYLERRGAYRNAHIAKAWQAQAQGLLVLAGAAGEPPDRAVYVFDAPSAAPIEAFVKDDPYYLNGLVARYEIQPWTTVVGKDAKTPIHPT
ncbi:MAG: YciI family protein [Acidovorax sp.]|jgi:uncharacterized protein YciI|nr:YciI family protein [Acidovorax sp.]